MSVEIVIKVRNVMSNIHPSVQVLKENWDIKQNLHPNYQLLKKLSKRGILDDQLIIKLGFF